MTKYILMILVVMTNVSCNNSNSYHYQDTIVGETISDSQQILNVKQQLMLYHDAIVKGEFDTAYNYLYTGMVKYYQLQYPTAKINRNSMIENLLKPAYLGTNELTNKGIKLDYVIGEIGCKTKYNKMLIYTVNTILYGAVKTIKDTELARDIAISNDDGLNWQFMELDTENTKAILTMNFDSLTANRIINCK